MDSLLQYINPVMLGLLHILHTNCSCSFLVDISNYFPLGILEMLGLLVHFRVSSHVFCVLDMSLVFLSIYLSIYRSHKCDIRGRQAKS